MAVDHAKDRVRVSVGRFVSRRWSTRRGTGGVGKIPSDPASSAAGGSSTGDRLSAER
jgi:hypothetical protein